MEVIVNEVELKKAQKEYEKQEKLKKEGKKVDEEKEDEKAPVVLYRTNTDIQKRKIEKLMSDMSKAPYIPEPRKEWKPREPPEFVRHVMGSSAGAGSGEFHVYRGIRKREKKRQDFLDKKTMKEELQDEFQQKLEENKKKADDATAKKRAKRQRRNQKKLMAKKLKKDIKTTENEGEKSNESENEEEQKEDDSHFNIGEK